MTIMKRVFHCAICGRVLHVRDDSHDTLCCGNPMHLAFKEYLIPSRWVGDDEEELVGSGFPTSSVYHSKSSPTNATRLHID